MRDKDKQDLVRRGFTDDQIKRVYARSVSKFQKLPFELPPGFPGSGKSGLANSVDGYIFPILSINKELAGFQIRCDDPDSKYRWLSSQEGVSKLPSGEQPLAFYWPKDKEPKFIALVEGTGPKPFLTCEQTDALVIGAAGGLWASSPSQIIGAIKHLESEYKGLPWRLMPDAGAIENPDIYREMWKISELLGQFDIKMEVAWWGQSSKPSPGTEAKLGDADEVSLSVLENAEIISSAQFFAMASPEVVKKANVNGLPVGGLDAKSLRQSAERLVLLTGFEKKAQMYVEAARLGVRAFELEMLVNTIYEEESPEYQAEIRESLGKLLGIGEQDLDIRAHVHENLAAPIEMIASRMGRSPRLYVHCMLPVMHH
ncbi:MAG: hypothetical protein HC771_25765 [Synechococcales cyanobacterium CRU_2_2]|nr:hypothetical protein [Synechococcales cyanobacterium CRU_2_2]